ncbi:MAG: 5-formyltetrahydrofolate cyclo-ligase [Ruminococcaceae bacterium]|nr:5-formyltetrahydrofolate cyclo-ligase [Oscillospiraceae bacterium]
MKDEIRKQLKEKRANMDKSTVHSLSTLAQEHFLSSELYLSSKTIMLYIPLKNETETDIILKRCLEDGKTVLLPVTDPETYRITPHVFTSYDALKKGAFSVSEPSSEATLSKKDIDLVVVPGIGFSKDGERIGFGKGCYDQFLSGYEGIAVGLCYDFQVAEFQSTPQDVPVDYIVTPSGITDCISHVMPMRANYHTHTYLCHHAIDTPREYVLEAIKNGLEILGFSDHNPCPFSNGFSASYKIDLCDTEKYVKEINSLREEFKDKIKIYLGYEMEYYPKEHENCLKYLKEFGVDYLILGQHFTNNGYDGVYPGNATTDEKILKTYVNQVIEGINTGVFTYIAHPDIINYQGDAHIYKKEITKLLREAKRLSVPVEFNLLGFREQRPYPCDRFWELVSDVGNLVVIGCDAHEKIYCGNQIIYKKAVRKLKKFGITPTDKIELRTV